MRTTSRLTRCSDSSSSANSKYYHTCPNVHHIVQYMCTYDPVTITTTTNIYTYQSIVCLFLYVFVYFFLFHVSLLDSSFHKHHLIFNFLIYFLQYLSFLRSLQLALSRTELPLLEMAVTLHTPTLASRYFDVR